MRRGGLDRYALGKSNPIATGLSNAGAFDLITDY
jgi:hypothetical protein